MNQHKLYPGIRTDKHAGMTDIGKFTRDAWRFGLLPETETCENRNHDRLEKLYDQVRQAWAPPGHFVGQLPDELRERHARSCSAAIERARAKGRNVELGDD